MKEILFDEALTAIAACKEKADSMKLPCVIVIVDNAGLVIAQARLDRVPPVCIDVAERKAYTAAMYGLPTSALTDMCQPGGDLFGLHALSGGKYVIFAGGLPIYREGRCVGAIGISGGQLVQDVEIASVGVAVLSDN